MEVDTLMDIEVEGIYETGPQGLSAYEVYQKNGGRLSEEEWLESLKGEKGEPGKDGINGINGVDGKDGIDGEPGPTYAAGENIIIDENNVISAVIPVSEEAVKSFTISAAFTTRNGDGSELITLDEANTAVVNELLTYLNESGKGCKLIMCNTKTNQIPVIELHMTDYFRGTSSSEVNFHTMISVGISTYNYYNASIKYDYNTLTSTGKISWGYYTSEKFMTANSTATIVSTHTYNKLPETSVAPTTDTQMVNKKYVDDSIKTAITDALGGEY